MINQTSIWTEKYRPSNFDEMVGQQEILKRVSSLVQALNIPHLLFAGPAGTGKSTLALIIVKELFKDKWRENYLELNASDERGIDVVRQKVKDFARTKALESIPFKVIFLDEADALTKEAQHALRRTMESTARNTRFILSCNYSSRIIEPLQSRCAVFRFLPLQYDDVKKMISHVAQKEELKVDENAEKALFYVSEGDMRKALNILQGCSLHSKKITEELVHKISSRAKPKEVKEMIEYALNGEFVKARENLDKLIITYGLSGEDVLQQIYREITELDIDEKKKIAIIDKLAEYDFRMIEGANERIQIEAMLAQFILIGKK